VRVGVATPPALLITVQVQGVKFRGAERFPKPRTAARVLRDVWTACYSHAGLCLVFPLALGVVCARFFLQ